MTYRVGALVPGASGARGLVEFAREMERLGFDSLWATSGSVEDTLPAFGAAAMVTNRLILGTAVVQAFPRHPVVLAKEANVLAELAPGRIRLGIGPAHAPTMEALGYEYTNPLERLREYIDILRELFENGSADHVGAYYRAQATIGSTTDVPIYMSALQRGSFRLAGEVADGAITFLCPLGYLRDVALPVLSESARAAGRATPTLVAHVPVCVETDREAVYSAIQGRVPNIRLANYQRMLVAAGFEDAASGEWTPDLIDEVYLWGDENRVIERLERFVAAGVDELMVTAQPAGPDPRASIERTLRVVADFAKRSDGSR